MFYAIIQATTKLLLSVGLTVSIIISIADYNSTSPKDVEFPKYTPLLLIPSILLFLSIIMELGRGLAEGEDVYYIIELLCYVSNTLFSTEYKFQALDCGTRRGARFLFYTLTTISIYLYACIYTITVT